MEPGQFQRHFASFSSRLNVRLPCDRGKRSTGAELCGVDCVVHQRIAGTAIRAHPNLVKHRIVNGRP